MSAFQTLGMSLPALLSFRVKIPERIHQGFDSGTILLTYDMGDGWLNCEK